MAKLPTVVSNLAPDLRAFVNRVREALDSGGTNRLLTVNDLISSGIAVPGPGGTIIPPSGGGVITTPPTPKNVAANGAIQNIVVTWDDPLYFGHAYAEVWGSSTDNLGEAVQIGMAPGAIFIDAVGPSVVRYYWVRFVNTLSTVGAFNAVDGVRGETGPAVEYLIDTLTDAALDPDSPYTKFAVRADLFYVMPEVDFNQESTPTATATGDLWYQPSTEMTRTWDGSAWSSFSVQLPFIVNSSPQTINGVAVPAGVYMDAAFIKNGTITNAKIGNAAIDDAKIANLSAGKITAGSISVGSFIQSSNYLIGSQGWKIHGDGTAEFAAAAIRGQLTAAQINSNGLSIRDTAGNIILNAGTGVFNGTTSASNVSGLGALATQNTVSGTTQVTGLGGFAYISTITSANISTYIAGAAIGTAYISNAAITNALIANAAITSAKIQDGEITNAKIGTAAITSAKIGTAEVDTIKIAGNAVTVPVSAFTAGIFRNTGFDTWQDMQTISITTSGSRVYIASSANYLQGAGEGGEFGAAPIPGLFRLVRDSTELMQSSETAMSFSETPSAGTYTYRLQCISTNSFGVSSIYFYAGASNRSLFVIETKR